LLSALNAMQMALHLPLISVKFPGIVTNFNSNIISFVKFDFVDFSDFFAEKF
jgi:hypothetical protein